MLYNNKVTSLFFKLDKVSRMTSVCITVIV